jgi:hypothetical protein
VWHVPGTSEFNAVVVEVKRSESLDNVSKDLKTLKAFVEAPERSYESGVLLVFGPANRADLRTQILRAADAVGIADTTRRRIYLLAHEAAERGTADMRTLAE